MTCQPCQARASNPNSGRVNFKCLECCAHLVASTNPMLDRAEGFFEVIAATMRNDAPDRQEVWKRAKQILRDRNKLNKEAHDND